MTDREKLLEELLSASKQMVLDRSWPVTEDELVKYHRSSFEFGFACGALWCKKSLPNEPVSEELKEAANKFAVSDSPHFKNEREYEILIEEKERVFKAGAQWKEQQMMKNAIERTVKVDAGGYPYIDATELYDYDNDKPLAKDGEKVKLIIVKEE